MANQFLNLSLFVMLLSFFIILNAVSDFEDTKTRPVLNSLAITFSSQDGEPELDPNVTESPSESVSEGDSLDKLDALFSAHISGVKTAKNRFGTVMHMRMSLKRFERAVKTSINAPAIPSTQQPGIDTPFLPTLISLMQTYGSETMYRMDMLLNIEGGAAASLNKDAASTRAAQNRITSIASALEAAGMQRKLLSAGLVNGAPGYVDLYFRRYETFDPVADEMKKNAAEKQEPL